MKKSYAIVGASIIFIASTIVIFVYRSNAQRENLHYEREETEFILTNISGASVSIFKAGTSLQGAVPIPPLNGESLWLPKGNYFLKVEQSARTSFYPIPILSYRAGPDKEGTFSITVRPSPPNPPPRLLANLPDLVFVPSGHFLFGDHLRIQEPHYIWLTGFFISPFEVTNAEFREFLSDSQGYADSTNWTDAGRRWKASNPSQATALLKPVDSDFRRFGQPDQPVVQINWFEANAFCHWLNKKLGGTQWIFALPTEAEWEKAARGPDNFDYGLGMNISDEQVRLYNWKKNPGADVTVVGLAETRSGYQPNRYGVYHMSGNVAEWTQSIYRGYNRQHPYLDDDDRNKDETPGERVLRGGSWYTASIAVLYLPYRENFQPEVHTPYLGFRVVARPVP